MYKRHARVIPKPSKQTEKPSYTHEHDTFLLTCIIKINYAHTHTQTQSESAMPKPKQKRGTWDTEFSHSLGQYCSRVCVSLSQTRAQVTHTYPFTRQQTHTDLEAVDELISDFLADWRASPDPRRARLRW